LINNAIKFTSKGEVYLRVYQINAAGEHLEIGFEVRDSGIGIPKEKLDKLFVAFSQVDSSTTRKYGGTGLGLVICEKLVTLMGGKISVESNDDDGSTFKFSIKAKKSNTPAPSYLTPNEILKNKRILIVDDNCTQRKLLEGQLRRWRTTPIIAGSAKEALIVLQENSVDLVLTDMYMPEINGVELSTSTKHMFASLPNTLLNPTDDDDYIKHKNLFSSIVAKPINQQNLNKQHLAQFQPHEGKKDCVESQL